MTTTQTTLETLNAGLVALRALFLSSHQTTWNKPAKCGRTVDKVSWWSDWAREEAETLCYVAISDLREILPDVLSNSLSVTTRVDFGTPDHQGVIFTKEELKHLYVTHIRVTIVVDPESDFVAIVDGFRALTPKTTVSEWLPLASAAETADTIEAFARAAWPPFALRC
jgi:hypothetical protein